MWYEDKLFQGEVSVELQKTPVNVVQFAVSEVLNLEKLFVQCFDKHQWTTPSNCKLLESMAAFRYMLLHKTVFGILVEFTLRTDGDPRSV